MVPPRDRFPSFERVRREIDDLFDDAWARAGFPRRQRTSFLPRVDVYYCGEPPQAVVKADLSGVTPENVSLELRGRTLIISGERTPRESEGRVYQQLEIEHGPFMRAIPLGADVDVERASATYEDGVLRVELPIVTPPKTSREVPVSGGGRQPQQRGSGRS